MYGRSVHTWVEELETKELLSAWQSTLDLIESLNPEIIMLAFLTSAKDCTNRQAALATPMRIGQWMRKLISLTPANT